MGRPGIITRVYVLGVNTVSQFFSRRSTLIVAGVMTVIFGDYLGVVLVPPVVVLLWLTVHPTLSGHHWVLTSRMASLFSLPAVMR